MFGRPARAGTLVAFFVCAIVLLVGCESKLDFIHLFIPCRHYVPCNVIYVYTKFSNSLPGVPGNTSL